MLDFTIKTYKQLLIQLKNCGYSFSTFEKYIGNKNKTDKIIILRHDVDKSPINSLKFAKIENEFNISASYYFRIVKKSNNPDIISQISNLGHEIGYHYEDLALAKGDVNKTINLFVKHLTYFRQFYPVKTICMHGSPLSKYDNRNIWSTNSYLDYDIIGEPYFDIDLTRVAYLTDTGRKWNADSENVRDKVDSPFSFDFSSTFDVINALNNEELPKTIMINTHPQRWTDHKLLWLNELVMQNCKNAVKRSFF